MPKSRRQQLLEEAARLEDELPQLKKELLEATDEYYAADQRRVQALEAHRRAAQRANSVRIAAKQQTHPSEFVKGSV